MPFCHLHRTKWRWVGQSIYDLTAPFPRMPSFDSSDWWWQSSSLLSSNPSSFPFATQIWRALSECGVTLQIHYTMYTFLTKQWREQHIPLWSSAVVTRQLLPWEMPDFHTAVCEVIKNSQGEEMKPLLCWDAEKCRTKLKDGLKWC